MCFWLEERCYVNTVSLIGLTFNFSDYNSSSYSESILFLELIELLLISIEFPFKTISLLIELLPYSDGL